jgi:hypothetical protein
MAVPDEPPLGLVDAPFAGRAGTTGSIFSASARSALTTSRKPGRSS